MAKKKISEDMNVHERWYDKAKNVTTTTLSTFINKIVNGYEHDYGTIAHAITASGLAAMLAVIKEHPISAQQANFIMWNFIYRWMYPNNKCGLVLLNYDNLLFPQYEEMFDKVLSPEVFEALQKEASDLLEARGDNIHEDVKAHLQSIVDGKPPFGFKIIENKSE